MFDGDRFLIDQTVLRFLYYMQVQDFLVFCFILLFFKKFFSASIILSKTKIQINHTNFKILICCAIILYLLFRSLFETSLQILVLIFNILYKFLYRIEKESLFPQVKNNFIKIKILLFLIMLIWIIN